MRPEDDTREIARVEPRAPSGGAPAAAERAAVLPPRMGTPAPIDVPPAGLTAPAELSGMLLPTEHVTFASAPHPIVLVAPVIGLALIAVALATALAWTTHPIVRGHHVTVPLLTGVGRTAVLVVAGLLALHQAVTLLRRLAHVLAYRVVTTNRRVFVVEGLFGRRVRPLAYSTMARATMSQSFLGQVIGYGSIVMPEAVLANMRDPVPLYRQLTAVANGVEGDAWAQPVRQTIIP